MSMLLTDTKGDVVRNYGTIAEKYYGYKISVIDLRNPTRSHGNNLLHLVNKYMDLYKAEPEQLVSNKNYIPCKKTVIALCLALELNREEADQLLFSAGYSLSPAEDYDLAIAFFIDKKVYDFFEINEVLEHFGFDVF